MEAETRTKWLKCPGHTLEKGEPLFEIDIDKVAQEVESDYAGVLLKMGGYGILRICLPIMPQISQHFAWWISLLGVL